MQACQGHRETYIRQTLNTRSPRSQPATRGCTRDRQAGMHTQGTLACLSLHGDILIWKQDGDHPPPAHLAPAHHPVGTGVHGDHNPLQSSTGTPACPQPSGRTASIWPLVLRGPDSCLQPRTNWTRGPPGQADHLYLQCPPASIRDQRTRLLTLGHNALVGKSRAVCTHHWGTPMAQAAGGATSLPPSVTPEQWGVQLQTAGTLITGSSPGNIKAAFQEKTINAT